MSTIQKADTRKSTNLLKKYLRERFNIEVSVKSEYYSMGSSLNISYNLGIDEKEAEAIVKDLQYSRFDGMTDCSYNVDNAGIIIDGYQLAEFKHVFVKQDWSDEFSYKLAKFLSDHIKFSGVPELISKDQMHTSFPELYGSAWTWSQLLWQLFKTSNFATQDESKINLLEVHHSDKNSWQIYFIYEVDGIKYNTEEIPTIQKETKPAPIETKTGEASVIEYSEKAIAVIGDTYPIKEKLKEAGGKFNKFLSCGAGWIFPKTKLTELQTLLNA